ncbi:hypothetical protein GCM10017687_35070 [Streptomyces echinatus]
MWDPATASPANTDRNARPTAGARRLGTNEEEQQSESGCPGATVQYKQSGDMQVPEASTSEGGSEGNHSLECSATCGQDGQCVFQVRYGVQVPSRGRRSWPENSADTGRYSGTGGNAVDNSLAQPEDCVTKILPTFNRAFTLWVRAVARFFRESEPPTNEQ